MKSARTLVCDVISEPARRLRVGMTLCRTGGSLLSPGQTFTGAPRTLTPPNTPHSGLHTHDYIHEWATLNAHIRIRGRTTTTR